MQMQISQEEIFIDKEELLKDMKTMVEQDLQEVKLKK